MEDTPPCKAPFSSQIDGYNCDTATNSCNLAYQGIDYPDLFENYMDYSGDACYNMFTDKQADFMRFVLSNRRSGIISKRETEVVSNIKITNNEANKLSLFPNPVQNNLNIKLEELQNLALEIYQIDGKLVWKDYINNTQSLKTINTTELKKGAYIIKLYNADFVTFEKFIKQ